VSIGHDSTAGRHISTTEPRVGSTFQYPHIAISQRQGGIQPGFDSIQGWQETIRLDFLKYLSHLIRLLPGLIDQVGAAKLQQHSFRARGYQAHARPDNTVARFFGRCRNFSQFDTTVFQAL